MFTFHIFNQNYNYTELIEIISRLWLLPTIEEKRLMAVTLNSGWSSKVDHHKASKLSPSHEPLTSCWYRLQMMRLCRWMIFSQEAERGCEAELGSLSRQTAAATFPSRAGAKSLRSLNSLETGDRWCLWWISPHIYIHYHVGSFLGLGVHNWNAFTFFAVATTESSHLLWSLLLRCTSFSVALLHQYTLWWKCS